MDCYIKCHLQKEAGDDAQNSVVKDEDENEGVCKGRKSSNSKGTGEFSFTTEKQHVANNGVQIHENILDHDVDVGALSLDQELIVDSRKDRTKDLDLKNRRHSNKRCLQNRGIFAKEGSVQFAHRIAYNQNASVIIRSARL